MEINVGSLTGVVTAIQQLALNISNAVTALKNAFPQAGSAVSHSATAGADTLPANPAGFLTITVGSNTYKIPMYNS